MNHDGVNVVGRIAHVPRLCPAGQDEVQRDEHQVVEVQVRGVCLPRYNGLRSRGDLVGWFNHAAIDTCDPCSCHRRSHQRSDTLSSPLAFIRSRDLAVRLNSPDPFTNSALQIPRQRLGVETEPLGGEAEGGMTWLTLVRSFLRTVRLDEMPWGWNAGKTSLNTV